MKRTREIRRNGSYASRPYDMYSATPYGKRARDNRARDNRAWQTVDADA
jgi:hypothetical protein